MPVSPGYSSRQIGTPVYPMGISDYTVTYRVHVRTKMIFFMGLSTVSSDRAIFLRATALYKSCHYCHNLKRNDASAACFQSTGKGS